MKPILFNTEMVRAILDRRKSVTRRIVKPQPICCGPNITFTPHDDDFFLSAEKHWLRCRVCGHDPEYSREGSSISHHWKPLYRPGDILYVRETFTKSGGEYYFRADFGSDYLDPCETLSGGYPTYCIFHIGCEGCCREPQRIYWCPSIHMPKKAARLFLRVTDVRVERLQAMSHEDAEQEGCWCDEGGLAMPLDKFADLWDSTIKKANLTRYGWDANPWVWVIEFEQIRKEKAQKG